MPGMPSRPCNICSFPTFYDESKPLDAVHICSQCHMIANDLEYPDGSKPSSSRLPVEQVKARYAELHPSGIPGAAATRAWKVCRSCWTSVQMEEHEWACPACDGKLAIPPLFPPGLDVWSSEQWRALEVKVDAQVQWSALLKASA